MLEDRQRPVHIQWCITCQQDESYDLLYYIKCLREKNGEYSWSKNYNDKMTWLIVRKYVVFRACDKLKVQKFVMELSTAVYVLQWVNLWCIELHRSYDLYSLFEVMSLTFLFLGAPSSPQPFFQSPLVIAYEQQVHTRMFSKGPLLTHPR